MNRLLERQISKHLSNPDAITPEMRKLLQVISDTYDHDEKDRKMLERSIELTSQELIELNMQLQAEAAELRRKEVHLNASQHIARIGSWEYNELTGELYWSDETYRIFGYEPGSVEVTLELFYSHVHPADLDKLKEAVKKAVDTKDIYRIVHRLTNGKTVYEVAEIIFDDNGNPLSMTGTVQDITNRIEAEQELSKAHSDLSALFQNMKDVFFSIDMVTGALIQMSDAAATLYGRPVEEFRQNPNLWYEVIYEEDKQVIQSNYPVMYAGHSFVQEYRIHHTDGSLRWVESRITPTLDGDGNIIRIDGINSDITRRKTDEITIRNNEYKLRSLIEHSIDAIMILNEKSEIIFASDSYARIMGYSPQEVLDTISLDQVYPKDRARLNKHLQKVLANPGKPHSITYRRVKKDGSIIWCEGIATNLLHKPEVAGIVVNFRDITERKNYENVLKYSEQKQRALLENSSEAIIVTDGNMVVTYASESLLRITGYNPADIKGHSIFDLAQDDEKEMLTAFMDEVVSRPGEPRKLLYRTNKKDGTPMWVERVSTNLLNDPAISGIVSNFMDVTERKEAEEAIKVSNLELRQRNEELDRFVYSVSHDLRAPLTSILGLIEISGMSNTVKEMKDNLHMIRQSVDKLDSFIRDILDYSKNARIELTREKIDLAHILDEITGNLKYLHAKPSSIQLRTDIRAAADFYSDKYRVGVILNNLVSNAYKYSKPGAADAYIGIAINITEEKAEIVIEDNGIGIHPQYHAQIYDMFFRATTITTGSGLGLYIVKETLKKLEGTITFRSEPDKGTIFFVAIPNLPPAPAGGAHK